MLATTTTGWTVAGLQTRLVSEVTQPTSARLISERLTVAEAVVATDARSAKSTFMLSF